MTGLGIQAWLLSSIGIRTAFAHREIIEMLEVLHILGNSYRLASLGVGSAVVYGRFTLDFCKAVVIGAVCNLASLKQHTFADSIQSGTIKLGGDPTMLRELFCLFDELSTGFEIVEPRKVKLE